MSSLQRTVQLRDLIRVCFPARQEILSQMVQILDHHGGLLSAHLIHQMQGQYIGLFLCERHREAVLALREAGLCVEEDVVLLVVAEHRPGALSHMLKVLSDHQIQVGFSLTASCGEEVTILLKTEENGRAEGVLKDYLMIPDESD